MAIAEPVRLNPDTMDSISAGTDLTFQLLVSPGGSSQTGVEIRSLLTRLQEKHVLDGTGAITTHAILDQLGQLISSLCGTAPCTIVVGDGKLQVGGSGASQTAQLVTYSSSTNQSGTYSFSQESLTGNSTFNVWSSVVVR